VHVNNPPVEYGEVLTILRPGDIVSQFLHGRGSGILDEQGRLKDAVRAARRRGIVFDVAHGRNHVNFPVVRRAFQQAPARAIGRSGDLGTFAGGAAGDAAVFAIEDGRFPYQDADGNVLEGATRWTPRLTVRAGRVSWRRWPPA
jgi:dihydroorotase